MKNISIYKITSLLIITMSIFASCETDITVNLPDTEEKLVVQGKIETDQKAFVYLTHTLGYFDPVNIPELSEDADLNDYIAALEASAGLIYDSRIVMTITSGGITDTLLPTINFLKFPYFGYQSKNMLGENGATYRLDIKYNDNQYWASTSIPQPVDIDSIWFEYLPDDDTCGNLGLFFIDPAGSRNFYTMETMTEDEQLEFHAPYFGTFAFDDNLLNGDTIYYTPLLKGDDSNDFFSDETNEENDIISDIYFCMGNTVNIKLSSIDKQTFVFWTSLTKHLATAGNPFTNPATLQSNIMGENCAGIWAGYGTTIKSVYIDESLLKE